MIKLDYFDDADTASHLSVLKTFVMDRLSRVKSEKLKLANSINTPYLDDLIVYLGKNIRQILIAKPAQLRRFITMFANAFDSLDVVLATKSTNRSAIENDVVAGLKWIFDYDAFSTWTSSGSARIAMLRI